MTLYDAKCPKCGHMNKDMDLWETDGWMKCEECLELTQFQQFHRGYKIPVFDMTHIPIMNQRERKVCGCI